MPYAAACADAKSRCFQLKKVRLCALFVCTLIAARCGGAGCRRSLLSRQLRYVSYRKLVAHVSGGALWQRWLQVQLRKPCLEEF